MEQNKHLAHTIMSEHKTDITPIHHPHEYEILEPEDFAIYIGTEKQCEDRLKEIIYFDSEYGSKCKIIKA